MRALARLLLALPPLLALATPTSPQDEWSEWRGGLLYGTSPAPELPLEIGLGSERQAWAVDVPGSGISSPVAHSGRVYLTSAYAGSLRSRTQAILDFGIPTILIGVIALLGARIVRGRRAPGDDAATATGLPVLVGRLDRLLFTLLPLAYVPLGLALVFLPERFWAPGEAGSTWIFTATAGLAGIMIGAGFFPARSPGRWLLAAVGLVAAWYVYQGLPKNKYNQPFSSTWRLLMVAPVIASAGWFVLVLALGRGAQAVRTDVVSAAGGLLLVASATLTFLTYNHWQPKIGLVRAALCYDLSSGELLWNTPLYTAPEERKHELNSFATPTPCAAEDGVVVDFGSGYARLDENGEVLWQASDDTYHGRTRYGASSSPIRFEDTVILLHVGELDLANRPSKMMALDWETGEERWRVAPDAGVDCYTTPVLARRGDDVVLLMCTTKRLSAYDPRTGEQLWGLDLAIEQMVPSLALAGDLLLVSGGTHGRRGSYGLRLAEDWRTTPPEVLWHTRRCIPDISSPVVVGELGFTASDAGVLTCYGLESGEVHWQERLSEPSRASLVAGDGKVYVLGDSGSATVVAAEKEFRVLHEGDLGSQTLASPAIVGSSLLVRNASQLLRFDAPGADERN